ncbi:PRC-barrel domain protein [Methyloligella halotolerans]|uniref:PRC-barrel domain protein n=1 Tax=Methyloligella halotolerans TaxID=1177755 RepID=A0A1E2RY71_9HYPH|nr:PRC-barrel domain-containing protein [Methyloligella halotolerans]ODA67177.1 PRC-barrel domain protein [Methyloligella halotolerans]
MKKLLSSTAIALLMTSGVAFSAHAQDDMTAEKPAGEAKMEAPAKNDEAKTTVKEAETTVTLLKTLPENSRPISEYYQEPVYDPDDNQVGDTNDLLIDESGKVTTVIIGVGGFLGVGEKNVAIPFDALELTETKDGESQLTLNATKGALEQAPGYKFDAEAQAWVPATEERQEEAAEEEKEQNKEAAKDGAMSDETMTDEKADEPMAGEEPADADMKSKDSGAMNDESAKEPMADEEPAEEK